MSLKKTIDVCAPVRNRNGEICREPKTSSDGRVVMTTGVLRRPDQIEKADEIALVDILVGRLLTTALDRQDDKLSPEERRKRFTLAARIEDAMIREVPFVMDPDDRKRIETAADLITHNHLFLYRIHQALETAEPVKEEEVAKSNGVGAHSG